MLFPLSEIEKQIPLLFSPNHTCTHLRLMQSHVHVPFLRPRNILQDAGVCYLLSIETRSILVITFTSDHTEQRIILKHILKACMTRLKHLIAYYGVERWVLCWHRQNFRCTVQSKKLSVGPCHGSSRRSGFEPGSVHVGFVMDKVALGQVFPRVLRFSPVNFIPPLLHYMEK
jgi:hypothetical protein